MHETGLAKELLNNIVLAAGEKKIKKVKIGVGELSEFTPSHLREHLLEEIEKEGMEEFEILVEKLPLSDKIILKSLEVRD